MICFIQLVDKNTGERSHAFSLPRSEIVDKLEKSGLNLDDVMLLVLVEDANNNDWKFSRAPLMSFNTFKAHFQSAEVASNE